MENKINIFNKPTRPISIGSVGNAVLQGNQVKITFPKAIDKTNYSKEIDEIEYQVRLSMYPILLTKTSTAPIEALKDATAVGSWTTLRGIKAAGTTDLNAVITIPNYITDALVGVEVRAVDDYKRTPTESVTIPSILSIANTKPAISAGTTEWTETSLKLFYNVNDLGLLKLANNGAMLDAPSSFNASYIAYRNEVIKWLGDISFSLDVAFEGSGTSKTVTNELFKLSSYDLLNTTKSITLLHSATGVNKDKGYTVTSSLTKKGALSTSKAVLLNAHSGESDAVIHLTASTPSLQIGKTGILVKLNEDQLDDTKAAGVFGRSEMHGVAGDSTKGASIALIDNRKGSNGLSLDQPALGFYANDDTEIGRIVAQEVDNGKYLAIKQQNFDPLYIRKNGTKLEYWEQGAGAGAGDWFTLLPEVMTTQMNADAQWNFDPSKPTTFRLGDSFYYKEGSGVILGNGLKITSGGIDVPIEEYLNNSVITKQVRVSSSHSLIAIDEVRQPIIANDTITITATATYDTTLTWTAKGFKGSTPTTLTVTPTNNKVTTTAKAIAPYDRVEYTVTSADGAADSVVISSIMQTESGAVTIDKTTEYYAANSTGIVPKRSDAVWNTDISKVLGTAKYIYNYFVVEKTNDYDYVSKPRMISSNGTAIPNTVRATRYYKRVNSGTVIPTSADTGWMNTLVQPTSDHKWLWTYLKPTSGTNFLDETYRTELIAIYGKISTPEIILHTAYADDDKGTNFSLVQGVRKYMGIYSSTAVEQSTAPSDYEWSLIKGEDGQSGVDGANFTWNILKNGHLDFSNMTRVVVNNPYLSYRDDNKTEEINNTIIKTYSNLVNINQRIERRFSSLEVGVYTYSLRVRFSETELTKGVWKTGHNISYDEKTEPINVGEWQTISIIFEVKEKTDSLIFLRFYTPYIENGASYEFDWEKLEKGTNLNPTWSPHESEIQGKDGTDGTDGANFTWNMINGSSRLEHLSMPSANNDATYVNNADGSITYQTNNTNLPYATIKINGLNSTPIGLTEADLNKDIVFSVEAKTDILTRLSTYTGFTLGGYNLFKEVDKAVGKWHRIWFTNKINAVRDLTWHFANATPNSNVQIRKPMLHFGTTPAPYAPHISEINGTNGNNFTWNLIKESKTNVVTSNNNATVPITSETLIENGNPFVRIKRKNTASEPTRMSLFSNFYFNRVDKMYANKRYTFSFEARASHEATATYWSQYRDIVAGGKTTTLSSLSTTTTNKDMGLTTAWDTFSITFTMPNDSNEENIIILAPIVTIPEGEIDNFYLDLRNWKLEEGENKNPTWSPHITEIQGIDGKDGYSFQWNLIKNGSLRDYVDTSLWAITTGTDYKTNSEYTRVNVTEYKKDNQFFYSLVGLLESGKTYTMSADVYIESYTEGMTNPFIALYSSGYYLKDTTKTWFTYGSVKPNVNLLNQWQTIYHTFTADEKINTVTSYDLILYFRDIVGAIRWKNIQLKETDTLTEWSPHESEIYGKDGAPGKGIKETKYRYAKTSAPSPEPTESQWSPTKPTYNKGDYAWTQVIWEYTDGTVENSAPMMSYIAEDGVGISDTLVAYALSTTNVQPADNLFKPKVPDSKPGDYVWTRVTLDYTNPDKTDTKFYTVARVGKDGTNAKLITLSASEQIFKNNTPTTITVTGFAQNTAITSWTYSSNSGAFTATLPAGVTRSGNTVTITQSTMTANTLTIKASDGTYSDTVSIAKLADGVSGTNGFTVLLTNESQTFPANSSGTVTSYAGGYSDVMAYYGGTPLTCTTTTTGLPTVNNTYTVTAITTTTGTVTLTPSLASSNYRITPSALTTDNAIRVLTIVARVNNTNYTFKKTLTYTKSKNGAQGPQGPQGVQGANGKDGIPGVAGKPGIGISKTVIDYVGSTSGTKAPTTGYTTTVPKVAPGNFLWTRTTWTYTDATTETSYSVGLIGKNGNTGKDGNPGKDGVGIDKTLIEYAKNTSGTVKPTTGWSTTIPSTVPGDFLWTRTTWTYTDTTTEEGYTVGKIGNTGPQGPKGAPGNDGAPGKNGIGITSTTIEYAVNQSGTKHPTTGWSGTVPKTNPGDYIWTKTTWKYTDDTSEDAYSVGRIGKDGPDGDDGLPGAPGVGIKMTTITYTKSTSGTVIPPSTANWKPAPPAGNPGEFIWTRTVWTYTNNATEEGYSVGMIGKTGAQGAKGAQGAQGPKGPKGDTGLQGVQGLQGPTGKQGIQGPKGANGQTSYTHIAYATNATGTTGFDTSDSLNKTYIGMYTDFDKTDSKDASKYKWTLIKGMDGKQGIQGPKGANGQTPYLHIAYANAPADLATFSTTNSLNKRYIGQYTDFKKEDSNKPGDYAWTLIKGTDGKDGEPFKWNIYEGGAILDKSRWAKYDANGLTINDEEIFLHAAKKGTTVMGMYKLNDYNDILESGKTYTISFDAKNLRDDARCAFGIHGLDGTNIEYLAISEEKRVSFTGTRNAKNNLHVQAINALLGVNLKFEMRNLKIEEGAVVNTFFTPHQDDNVTKTEFNTYRETTDSTIQDYVEETTTKTGNNAKLISTVSSDVAQEKDKVTTTFKRIEESVKDNKRTIETITATIRDGVDEKGNPYTEWGKEGDSNVMRIKNTGLYLLSNNIETIKLEDGKAYAEELHVTERIGFGNHTAQKHSTEFTIFVWTGGTK